MELGHIELLVDDPKRSQQFYCDVLGFELVAILSIQMIIDDSITAHDNWCRRGREPFWVFIRLSSYPQCILVEQG